MTSKTTHLQIAELQIDPSKPLVVCDVDEVVVHFIAGLERYLVRNGLWLDAASFALNGNIKYQHTNTPVPADELNALFANFFDEEIHRLDSITGAAQALSSLAEDANIVMLTNLPDNHRDARIANLEQHGMPFGVVTNQGPKGPAVRALTEQLNKPAVFIDDIPNHLQSVNDCCPQVHLIHFMQDERFARHVPKLDYVSLRADNWQATHSHISTILAR